MARKKPTLTDVGAFAGAAAPPEPPPAAPRSRFDAPIGRPRGPRLEPLAGRVPPELLAAWRSSCVVLGLEQQRELAAAVDVHLRALVRSMRPEERVVAMRRAQAEVDAILIASSKRGAALEPDERSSAARAVATIFEEYTP